MGDYGSNSIPHQAVVNAHEVPPRHLQVDRPEIRVRARLVWETDGEQVIETTARASAPGVVLVWVSDPRARFNGYWLDPADVQRI